RLLIAFLLMGLVMFVTPYFYKPAPPLSNGSTKTVTPVPGQVPGKTDAGQTDTSKPVVQKPPPVEPIPGAIKASQEETTTIDTDIFQVTFSNKGGVVRSWV